MSYKANVNPSHLNIEKIQPVSLSMSTNKGVALWVSNPIPKLSHL
jgi:hypothetical protein